MNAWIEHDDVLSGTVNALPDNIDFGNLQHNAKFLTDKELDRSRSDLGCLMAQGRISVASSSSGCKGPKDTPQDQPYAESA